MKTSKITILILLSFVFTAFVNVHPSSGMADLAKASLSTLTIENEAQIKQASIGGVPDPHNVYSLVLVSIAIIFGIFFILIFNINRRKKIIAVQKSSSNTFITSQKPRIDLDIVTDYQLKHNPKNAQVSAF